MAWLVWTIMFGRGCLGWLAQRYQNRLRWAVLFVGLFLMVGCSTVAQVTATPPLSFIAETLPPEYVLAVQAANGQLDSQGHTQLAAVYALQGNRRAALAHHVAAAHQQDTADAWLVIVDRLFAQRDWWAGYDVLTMLNNSDPTSPVVNYQLGILLAPYNPRLSYDHLVAAAAGPEYAAAGETLQAAIIATAMEAPADQYLQIGMALAAQEQWGGAEQAFALAVAFDPAYAEAWAYLGLVRAQQHKAAAVALDRALVLAADSPIVLLLAGLVEQIQGDYAAALPLMTQAQTLDPQNPAIAAEVGNAYRLTGDYTAAEQWLQAAAGLALAEPQFMTLLALFYGESGYDLSGDGFALLQEAVAQQPENAGLQAVYAWRLFNQGDAQAALETIAQARFLEPANPRVLYYQGLLYQATNQTDLAVDILQEVLHHPAPEGFDVLARRVLGRLR